MNNETKRLNLCIPNGNFLLSYSSSQVDKVDRPVDEWQLGRVRAKHAAVGHVVASIMHVRPDTHAVSFVNAEVDCRLPFTIESYIKPLIYNPIIYIYIYVYKFFKSGPIFLSD